MTPYIDGIPMSELDPVDKEVVMKELEQHIATLRSLRSKTPGIPGTSIICPHYRLFRGWKPLSVWKWKPKPDIEEYVFCHNDVGQHNVLVDTKSLKIKAIIDWEFSGFFPRWFEAALWKQTGSAPTIGDEDRLRAWLIDNWLPYYWNLLFTHHHRLTAHDLVSGYSGNCFKGFKTFDMAKDYLKRNGCFTFYILEEPADGPKPKSNKRAPRSSYYAVANGRHVGIYSDYKTGAEPQVKKYSGACHKSYATFESANAAMQAREQIEYRIPVTDMGSDTTDEDEIVAGVNNMTLET